ncbi:MAG: RT0821/Lpp0805 family surface protein [Xanthobacteraceae bacterium]
MASLPSALLPRAVCNGSFCAGHAVRRLLGTGALLNLALTLAGCSFSYQLDNLFLKDASAPLHAPSTASAQPPGESDLAMARSAASEVLASGGKDSSMPWENPQTGARGTITPLANAYTQDGTTCRDFLASYVHNGSESWLQGEACRAARGRWEVRRLRP